MKVGFFSSLPVVLLVCLVQQVVATSTIFIKESNTTFALNLSPDSDDVNFYMAVPDLYQYTGIGFGATMANSLMFLVYANNDRNGVTLSPRLSTGNTEPVFYPAAEIILHEGTRAFDHTLYVNATCRGCRSWEGGSIEVNNPGHPMIFGLGITHVRGSDDKDMPLRRHMGYGVFSMDMVKATTPGGVGVPKINATDGAVLPKVINEDHGDRAATAHGVVFAIVALVAAPFDSLVAGALRKWPTLHMITATVYFALVIGALVPGINISKQYIMTQKMQTGHQVLGLLTVVMMFGMVIWGIALVFIRKLAKKRGQEPPERSALMGRMHAYIGWLIWLLFLINNGLGLKLADQGNTFILGYAVLAGAVVIFMIPIYWLVWRCTRPRRDKEEDNYQLNTIYNHDQQHGHNMYQ
ncbi:hypothetical protein B0H66DRAFT_220348 [Apodospora peruviana]|uniref:DOMON domain-containing protein n=1 Tax=Apodospora peruviana TaxID=516989 RepID=A0AAE0I3X7_9PEZI|nr:hypothetical protein B0H66DRAFT_220348 [Apodospora peruviana]